MTASAQIAIYPLRQERLTPAVEAVQQALRDNGLQPEAGPMSTYVVGEDRADPLGAPGRVRARVRQGTRRDDSDRFECLPDPRLTFPMATTADPMSGPGRFGPDAYADWRASSLGEITEALEHRVTLELTGPLQDQSVLDVGCGDGTLALAFANNGAARVTGCDLDPRMVARARAGAIREGRRTNLAVARSQALPFPTTLLMS